MVDRRIGSRGSRRAAAEPIGDDEAPASRPEGERDGGQQGAALPAQPVDVEEARRELEGAAADLERVTDLLHERTEVLDTLEALVDHLLDLVDVPLVVVDAEGRITAVSRRAADADDHLADALGKPARTVLPPASLLELAPGPEEVASPRVVALPRGSSVVRLDT